MADTIAAQLQVSAGSTVDLKCAGHDITEALKPTVEPVASSSGPPAAKQKLYTRTWTLRNVQLSAADYNTLASHVTGTGITPTATYPVLKLYDTDFTTPSSYDVYYMLQDFDLSADATDTIKRTGTVVCVERSKTRLTFVVDSGGSNEVTVDLVDLEAVRQTVKFIEADTTDGDGAPVLTGPAAVRATVAGYVATGDLDKLQKVLDARTAVEMVGACFDTTGGGYLVTELPSGSEAFLTDLAVTRLHGDVAYVQLVIVHDRT